MQIGPVLFQLFGHHYVAIVRKPFYFGSHSQSGDATSASALGISSGAAVLGKGEVTGRSSPRQERPRATGAVNMR